MNLTTSKLSAVILFISFLCVGCEKEKSDLPPLSDKTLQIIETNSSGCKQNLKSTKTEQYIKLKAESGNRLRLTFVNATINCAGLKDALAYIENGVLKVSFIEDPSADCTCDYDLECVIDSMEKRKYNAQVFINGEEPKSEFSFTYSSKLNLRINVANK